MYLNVLYIAFAKGLYVVIKLELFLKFLWVIYLRSIFLFKIYQNKFPKITYKYIEFFTLSFFANKIFVLHQNIII